MEKCYTDVTEFAIPGEISQSSIYPSIKMASMGEIVAYNLSRSLNLGTSESYARTSFYRGSLRKYNSP